MAKTLRTFTKEFKMEAVQLLQSSQKSQAQLARELGIADSTLSHWCKQFAEHGEQAFPGSGHLAPLEEENRQLKRELEVVRQERDILKKRSCRKATPMLMKMGEYTVLQREALRSRLAQWSTKPDKKAG